MIILRGRRPSGKSTAIMVTITKNYNDNKVWRYRKKPFFLSFTYLKLFLFLWILKYYFGSSDNSITGQNHHWWTLIIIFILLCSPWFPPLFSIYFIFGIVPCIITTYGLHFLKFLLKCYSICMFMNIVTLFYLFIFLYIPNS